jgi:death-on-curing protein
MDFVTLDDALFLVSKLGLYVKDAGLLDSALSRPKTKLFGEFVYPTIELMAAAMHQSLVNNHPLIDGNKRAAWVILNAFVELNNHELEMTVDEGMDFTLGVAEGRYDIEESAALIKAHLKG